jgi:hypothetical protein
MRSSRLSPARARTLALGVALAALAGALPLLGCANDVAHARAGDYDAKVARMGGGMAAASLAAEAAPAPDRMVIRTGSITVEVEEPEVSLALLTARIEQLGGYVADTTTGEEIVHLSARVPAGQLESFLDEVGALGEEKTRSLTGRDVSEEYADIEAELANLVALRDRLRTLLDRAEKVKEVLEVERELTRVQTRIDWITGRKERIEKDVALSQVSITLEQEPAPRILGPLGLLYEGGKWLAIKLFVISP